MENIRKDLEKLLRERTTGVWFHTLNKAQPRTLASLMIKFRTAFGQVAEHVQVSDKSFLICFAVLQSGVLTKNWLHCTGDPDRNVAAIEKMFGEHDAESGWVPHRFRNEDPAQPTGSGARDAYLVLIQSIAADTFLHLSIRGDSYRLRNFQAGQPRPFIVPGQSTLSALRSSSLVCKWVRVSEDDLVHSLKDETGYWQNRIRTLNSNQLS